MGSPGPASRGPLPFLGMTCWPLLGGVGNAWRNEGLRRAAGRRPAGPGARRRPGRRLLPGRGHRPGPPLHCHRGKGAGADAADGETYETWVAGRDPETGAPRGRLRTDTRAVRFVEMVVNGPKSWSLAAAVHPDIAAAYDAAQDRAAAQIIGWLAGHATARVGPRGGQVQVPVEVLEAVTMRHYTSRAGDPHRHLHLQINARVFAAGKWRGLHTVGVRD